MSLVDFKSGGKQTFIMGFSYSLGAELERTDIVAMNLSVARGIESLKYLDIAGYVRVVNDWTHQFAQWLIGAEQNGFNKTPEKWKNDIRFFRIGMLQGFLGHHIGIKYIEEQKKGPVYYENPGDLFLHGLIDRKLGTCATMPALHAAMARRMGWPVSLACTGPHHVSRFDDGQVIYNIEATNTHTGSFRPAWSVW